MINWLKQLAVSEDEWLDQLAGFTGLGWTGSLLGYLVTLSSYGNALAARLVVDPKLLLYLGCMLFVTTFGLDRLQHQLTNGEQEAGVSRDEPTGDAESA